jgi:hypothetical protein
MNAPIDTVESPKTVTMTETFYGKRKRTKESLHDLGGALLNVIYPLNSTLWRPDLDSDDFRLVWSYDGEMVSKDRVFTGTQDHIDLLRSFTDNFYSFGSRLGKRRPARGCVVPASITSRMGIVPPEITLHALRMTLNHPIKMPQKVNGSYPKDVNLNAIVRNAVQAGTDEYLANLAPESPAE